MTSARFEELLDQYVDGLATDEEAAELRKFLESDAEARKAFYDRLLQEAHLFRTCKSETALRNTGLLHRFRVIPAGQIIAVAAAALFAITVGFFFLRRAAAPVEEAVQPAAPAPEKREPEPKGREASREAVRPRVTSGGFKDYASGTLTVTTGERTSEERHVLAPNAEIIADGVATEMQRLPRGCHLTLTFSSDGASVIKVQAKGGQLAGQLKSIDPVRGTFVLAWGKEKPVERELSVARNGRVLLNGQESRLADLAVGSQAQVQLTVAGDAVFEVKVGRASGDKPK